MTEIVLDTNVLVSGMLTPGNPPGRIVDLLQARAIRLVVDDRILDEYANVLQRPYLAKYLTAPEIGWVLEFLRHASRPVVAESVIGDLPDPKDACFLEVALAAGIPLVTGNLKHFPPRKRRGITVYSPREFIEKSAI